MYYVIVTAFMLLLPLVSIAAKAMLAGTLVSAALTAKWFAFWSVGWRLLLAGVKQIAQPQYTAREILGLKSDESLFLVRELGFANVAMGSLCVLSLFVPGWQLAAALAGGIFYGFAGIAHALHGQRSRLQNVAMISDLFASVVLLGACLVVLPGG